MTERGHQILARAADRRTRTRVLARRQVLQALEQRLDLFGPLFEMLAPLVSHLERLVAAVARRFLDQAHVLEQGQGRIDHAGAGRILAAGQVLDRADEVVTVARLVGDQLEQDEPKLARFEHASAAASPPAAPCSRRVTVSEIEAEWSPATLPSATAAHGEQRFRKIDLDAPAWSATVMSMIHMSLL